MIIRNFTVLAVAALLTASCNGTGTSPTTGPTTTTTSVPVGPLPVVSSLSPTLGSSDGGAQVTVTGTGLTGATQVTFGTTAVTTPTVNDDTSVSVTAPAGAAGTVHVTVTTPGGVSNTTDADVFTFDQDVAQDLSLSAATVSPGQSVIGTVTIKYPAPNGGLSMPITWSSSPVNSTAVLVPQNAVVHGGSNQGTFQISTFFVSRPQQITVNISYGGVAKSATFTVQP